MNLAHRAIGLLLLAVAFVGVVDALPNGAPVCITGQAAPASLHLDRSRNSRTGEISAEGFQVFLNDQEVVKGVVSRVQVGVDYVLKIVSSTGTEFKGALVLLSHPDSSTTYNGTLSVTSPQYKLSPVCAGEIATGITHVDRTIKTLFEAGLNLKKNAKDVALDVNIVLQNNATGSAYFYSRFQLEVFGGKEEKPPSCGPLGLKLFCACGLVGKLLGLCRA
jgi:hypothetical protein